MEVLADKARSASAAAAGRQSFAYRLRKNVASRWQLYVLMLLPLLYLIVFKYVPMYGAIIAFKNYIPTKGMLGSEWVGFKHFIRFFHSYEFARVMKNTLLLSFYGLFAGFPFPIILALSLNYVNSRFFKKTVQMVTYAPHFISVVVMVGIILQMLDPRVGLSSLIMRFFGLEPINFMGEASMFSHIYVWSGIWQNVGFSCIIYLAALAAIDPALHDAAVVDGANKIQRMRHIDLPGILPVAVILLIMSTGDILDLGFEKILLMQNPLNMSSSEVIDTFVYKVGLASTGINYSYSSAIGLFKSVINLILLVVVNRIARKVGDTSLW
ncbi:multiple sugar transport system permease protein [Paenibacillus sp. UNCCL117]|uniref:ABC transporter permease n=1 Tax=unclassified Paenibacillus TaxID=185978 RepID=UPI000887AD67|nr:MULTISPECIES: ABC transporter permease subunit [unclassified Paenibacillus]SDD56504.1 multiple sugar transport system permease protein [Paenibacillus sp. cl123]SFW51376.1 multiple sugar transport system permease protein [Paenibacillus sp. UNCCL117]